MRPSNRERVALQSRAAGGYSDPVEKVNVRCYFATRPKLRDNTSHFPAWGFCQSIIVVLRASRHTYNDLQNAQQTMQDLIPLLQTLLWICFALVLILVFRPEIKLIREILAKRLKEGGVVEFGPFRMGELKAELNSVREDLQRVNDNVAKLFLTTMAPLMYVNLRKLASGNFGPYEMSKGLEGELYHLRDVGYITVESIKAIPKSGENLSDYVQVTETGKLFVELRGSVNLSKDERPKLSNSIKVEK
jgi:hypothetical protein